jgi:hypothetical protein
MIDFVKLSRGWTFGKSMVLQTAVTPWSLNMRPCSGVTGVQAKKDQQQEEK